MWIFLAIEELRSILSFFKCPVVVVEHICDGCVLGKRKRKVGRVGEGYHLLNWVILCMLENQGGMGLRSMKAMNQALLGKWPWRLRDATEALWKEV